MKNRQTDEGRKSRVESRQNAMLRIFRSRRSSLVPRRAFTLVELLVIISIIGVIAAFLLPVAGAVKRKSVIHTVQTEMAQLETAIDRYKAAYGFYPPDSPFGPLVNQLYYELGGTTNITLPPAVPNYQSFNDANLPLTGGAGGQVSTAFGVDGFMNCNKPNADESTPQARNFLPDLKPRQVGRVTNNGVLVTILTTSVGGPDRTYQPLNAIDKNPWRYNSSNPTNNPGSYDLWVQLVIGGKTNLICNWNNQVQINSPLP